jgi:hypothetical protein
MNGRSSSIWNPIETSGDDEDEPSGRNPRAKQHLHLPTRRPQEQEEKARRPTGPYILLLGGSTRWPSPSSCTRANRRLDATNTENSDAESWNSEQGPYRMHRTARSLISGLVVGEEREMLEEEDKRVGERSPSMAVVLFHRAKLWAAVSSVCDAS